MAPVLQQDWGFPFPPTRRTAELAAVHAQGLTNWDGAAESGQASVLGPTGWWRETRALQHRWASPAQTVWSCWTSEGWLRPTPTWLPSSDKETVGAKRTRWIRQPSP